MRPTIRPITLCLALITLHAIGGCAFLKGAGAGSAFVAADRQQLLLPASSGAQAVAHRSPYAYQEYVRSEANGQAEAVFLAARTAHSAIDIENRDLARLNARWRHHQAGAVQWLDSDNERLPRSQIEYRRFRIQPTAAQAIQNCAAFIRTWDTAAGDPLLRPRRAYFGYYCRPTGQALSIAALHAYLRRIRVTERPTIEFALGKAVPRDSMADDTARGAGRPGLGIRSFPLNFIRQFPIGAGYNSGR